MSTGDKLLVGKIEKGIVIDHITPCKGLLVLKFLNPDPETRVVIAKNVKSSKYGRKDLVKIEGEFLTSIQIDILALITPTSTINVIDGWKVKEKKRVRPPKELSGIIDCKNPACFSKGQNSRFVVEIKDPIEHSYFECVGCGFRIFYQDAIDEIIKKASSGVLVSKKKVEKEFLNLLLKKGGLRLNGPFKLKSGRISPYFVNLGALTDGESLSKLRWILAGFITILLNEKAIEEFDFVFGPSYKGINLAALTCEGLSEFFGLNKRYLYDRKELKGYGDLAMDRQIVGAEFFRPGQRILIVDDTITTGRTKMESIGKLGVLEDHKVVGVVVGVDRQEVTSEGKSAVQYLEDALGVKVHPILTAKTIYSLIRDILKEEERRAWKEYYDRYGVVKLEE